jgi:hypothetical protein
MYQVLVTQVVVVSPAVPRQLPGIGARHLVADEHDDANGYMQHLAFNELKRSIVATLDGSVRRS